MPEIFFCTTMIVLTVMACYGCINRHSFPSVAHPVQEYGATEPHSFFCWGVMRARLDQKKIPTIYSIVETGPKKDSHDLFYRREIFLHCVDTPYQKTFHSCFQTLRAVSTVFASKIPLNAIVSFS